MQKLAIAYSIIIQICAIFNCTYKDVYTIVILSCDSTGGVQNMCLLTGRSATVGSIVGTAVMVVGGLDDAIAAVPTHVHIVHSLMPNRFKCAVLTSEGLTVMTVSKNCNDCYVCACMEHTLSHFICSR